MRARGLQNATLAAVCGLGLLLTACGGLFDVRRLQDRLLLPR